MLIHSVLADIRNPDNVVLNVDPRGANGSKFDAFIKLGIEQHYRFSTIQRCLKCTGLISIQASTKCRRNNKK